MSTDENPTKTQPQDQPADIVWGAKNIGQVLNLTERQAFHLLEKKKLPTKKVGGKHCGSRARLLEACGA